MKKNELNNSWYNLTRETTSGWKAKMTPKVALDMAKYNFGNGKNAHAEPKVCDALLSPEEVQGVLERLNNVGEKPALSFEELFDGLDTE